MTTIKKYTLKAIPERTVVRIPLGGKINTMQALLKEIKKQGVPSTAKMQLTQTSTYGIPSGREARFTWPTSLTA